MSGDPTVDRVEAEERTAAIGRLLLVAAGVAGDALAGRRPDGREIADALITAALAFVPEADLRQHLDAAAVARAERIADAASRFARAVAQGQS